VLLRPLLASLWVFGSSGGTGCFRFPDKGRSADKGRLFRTGSSSLSLLSVLLLEPLVRTSA